MKIITFIIELVKYAINKDIGRHAQSLSFSTVLTLVPLTTIFFGVFASSSDWMGLAKTTIESLLENNLFPKPISDTFINYITIFSNQASDIKHIGLIFFIISIFLLFKDMEDSFSTIANCHLIKKWYFRIFSLFLLFMAPLIVFLFLGLAEWITNMSFTNIQTLIHKIVQYTLFIKMFLFLLTWMWFLFLYKVLPHKKIQLKSLLLGSFIATLIFNLSQFLFGLYLTTFSTYEVIYGVFSAIPIFLLWIYLNWQITLYGLLFADFYNSYISTEH